MHGDDPSEVTPGQFRRFLVDSPLIRETVGGNIIRPRKPSTRCGPSSRSAPVLDDASKVVKLFLFGISFPRWFGWGVQLYPVMCLCCGCANIYNSVKKVPDLGRAHFCAPEVVHSGCRRGNDGSSGHPCLVCLGCALFCRQSRPPFFTHVTRTPTAFVF